MSAGITVSVSVVTYNDLKHLPDTIDSIVKNTKKYPLKFYIIDNGSTDGTIDFIENTGYAKLIKQDKNLGFGAAHNKVLNEDLGKYHFIVNPDILFDTDVISDMVDYFEDNPDVAMAMPKILNTDKTEQKLPKEKPTFKRLFLGRLFKNVRKEYAWVDKETINPVDIDFCSGCFFGIRTDTFKQLCGFDERYFMYLEDADLTLKVKKKARVQFLPQISIVHAWERASAKSVKYFLIHLVSCFKFIFKWRGQFK